jgi:hypothetical protein
MEKLFSPSYIIEIQDPGMKPQSVYQWAGWLRFHSWQVQEIFLFCTMSRLALEPISLLSNRYW